MGKKRSREQLQKTLQHHRRFLPFGFAWAVVMLAIIWGIIRWTHSPYWFYVLYPFALPVAHLVAIIRCRWALRPLRLSGT